MYQSTVALKAWQKAALAATAAAISLGSVATAFVGQEQPSAKHHHLDHYFPKPRIVTAFSGVRVPSPFLLSRVQCQQASWEPEESTDYHYEKMTLPTRAVGVSHVIFGILLHEGCIESYEVYKRVSDKIGEIAPEVVLCDVRLGDKLDGHLGVVHGGILALLFDDVMGFAFDALEIEMAVTANLNIDFRAPVPANSRVVVRVCVSKQEGRKLYFSAQLTSLDSTVLYAEATSLYIIPKAL
jgi:acyl-coenzyme A thioesterase PaaI-like protein